MTYLFLRKILTHCKCFVLYIGIYKNTKMFYNKTIDCFITKHKHQIILNNIINLDYASKTKIRETGLLLYLPGEPFFRFRFSAYFLVEINCLCVKSWSLPLNDRASFQFRKLLNMLHYLFTYPLSPHFLF